MEANTRFGGKLERTVPKNQRIETEISVPATGLHSECCLQQELYSKVLFHIHLCIVNYSFCILPTLEKICADGGYRGTFVYEAYKYFGLRVEISKKLKPHGWQVLPKRWIVERTFSWLNHSRRLSKDYELTIASAETLIKISHIHTLLNRL